MEDGIVRKLKEVRYVPQLKRNLISVGALEALGIVIFVRDGVLKMIKGSMVVMKGVHRDNLYYLKGSTITCQVDTSSSSDNGCPEVWQVKVGQAGERSLQAPAKKGSLEGAATCCYLQLGGLTQRSGQEEGEIQHQYTPLRKSS